MFFIKDFIQTLFVLASFNALRKSKDKVLSDVEGVTTKTFIVKFIFHLALLIFYLMLQPFYPWVVIIFIILQVITGVWILVNKESYIATFEAIPELVDKISPLAYLLYFGYNVLSFLF